MDSHLKPVAVFLYFQLKQLVTSHKGKSKVKNKKSKLQYC